MPTVTCADKDCGTINNDGCGNKIDCPDNCVAPFVCGGNGQQFKCGCTPKSCADQGKNCGTVDDLCGAKINCGNCDKLCGADYWNEFQQEIKGIPNVCSTNCTKQLDNSSCIKYSDLKHQKTYLCIHPEISPLNNDCVQSIGNSWCCKN